jgi:hypothetical protein
VWAVLPARARHARRIGAAGGSGAVGGAVGNSA